MKKLLLIFVVFGLLVGCSSPTEPEDEYIELRIDKEQMNAYPPYSIGCGDGWWKYNFPGYEDYKLNRMEVWVEYSKVYNSSRIEVVAFGKIDYYLLNVDHDTYKGTLSFIIPLYDKRYDDWGIGIVHPTAKYPKAIFKLFVKK